ncbi:GtrA family protein [Lacrimispora amygdalina]|uniref:GtrA family protein n=1 Tax=Lacrimispora amygdalina TaxID=253257 RepID=A0A3E2N4S4_9FIRM|nr:GtrA family protein [Clostridium indicum]RFZ75989.1 GtrA family protein [Clostridium indicum]
MSSIVRLINKYRDIIPYAIFGVLTTIVNVITYWIAVHLFLLPVMAGTIFAWTIAVSFAYVTNRRWVFHSGAKGIKTIIAELVSFFICRLATGAVDWLCMFICVDILKYNDVIIKTAANILVIVLNYIASKLIIFKNSKDV